MPEAALCSRCGAPARAEQRACGFCGTAFTHAPSAEVEERVDTKLQNFLGALAIEGKDLTTALTMAIPAVLGRNPEAPGIAHGVIAVIQAFERDEDVKLDAIAAARVFAAYLRARAELRSVEQSELNLPFLTVNETGPKHLQRMLRRSDLVRLES